MSGALTSLPRDRTWRSAPLAGLFSASLLYGMMVMLLPTRIEAGADLLVASGLLVGMGRAMTW